MGTLRMNQATDAPPSIELRAEAAYPSLMPTRAGPWPTATGLAARNRWKTYGVAVAAAAACFGLQLLFFPILHERAVFVAFVPAVLASGVLGGAGPTLTVTALGLLAGWAVGGPALIEDRADLTAVALFVIFGVGTALVAKRYGRTEFALAFEDLAEREAHLRSILDT